MLLYNSQVSGNCYKVRLLLAHLDTEYERREVDVVDRSNRAELLGELNPALRVPTLVLDDGRALAESNAILWYLGRRSPYVPEDPFDRAKLLQWMFFEQYSHEPYIAVARFWQHFSDKLSPQQELELPGRMEKGYAALGVMEKHLGRHEYFVGGRYGLADIALYGYTHVAAEGSFDLDPYPHVCAWLARVAAQPGHVTIDHKN